MHEGERTHRSIAKHCFDSLLSYRSLSSSLPPSVPIFVPSLILFSRVWGEAVLLQHHLHPDLHLVWDAAGTSSSLTSWVLKTFSAGAEKKCEVRNQINLSKNNSNLLSTVKQTDPCGSQKCRLHLTCFDEPLVCLLYYIVVFCHLAPDFCVCACIKIFCTVTWCTNCNTMYTNAVRLLFSSNVRIITPGPWTSVQLKTKHGREKICLEIKADFSNGKENKCR